MSNAMDEFKLIAEIRKRPVLWVINGDEPRSRRILQTAWQDVAVAMGSNVNDCRRLWKSLRDRSGAIVKKIELRIKEDKQKGSYNPNNDYSSKWPYLQHMEFSHGMKLGNPSVNDNKSDDNDSNQVSKVRIMDNTKLEPERDLEMSNAMDKFKLIAEVRKRPALWDINGEEPRSKRILQTAWKDVAISMGSNVNECSRKWKSLRSRNRAIVNKIELRIQEAKQEGSYNPNNDYGSEWIYLEHMTFINDIKKPPVNDNKSDLEIHKFKLIGEIRKRPALWDVNSKEHRTKPVYQTAWKDVAVAMGSDVNDCTRLWKYLRDRNRVLVKKIELRIKEAKLKGSYNPHKDYSSQWPYLKHMEFMKDNTTGSIKLRHSGDKFKLIAEVRKRPELWCIKRKEYKPRLAVQKIWEDLAQAMGAEVDDCKLKWTRLLNGYRVEVKKLELRIKEDKLNGSYNPKKQYRSKWIFYERMKFCDDFKNPSLMELENTFVNDNNSDDNDSNQVSKFQKIKMEEEYLPDDEHNSSQTSVGVKSNFSGLNLPENQDLADDKPTTSNWKCTKRSYDQANCLEDVEKEEHSLIKFAKVEPGLDDEDYDTDSQMSGMEFLSEPNSPQNQGSPDDKSSSTSVLLEDIEKEEHNFTKSAKVEPGLDLDPEVYIPDDEDDDTDSQISGMEFLSEPNSPQHQESADDKPSSTGVLLEDIEKEEHSLLKSTKVEPELDLDPEVFIPDDDTDSQMSDSDYNFCQFFAENEND